jgi:peptidoglycan/xylan/chitin deacetylase (PgdA/CDA1 family)
LTFDDGLRSVAEVAHPVLRELGVPYTVFVCTEALTGGPAPWFLRVASLTELIGIEPLSRRWGLADLGLRNQADLTSALKEFHLDELLAGLDELEHAYGVAPPDPRDVFMSINELRTLAAEGVAIGSHTHRHPILSRLSADEQWAEIEQSASVIHGWIGRRPMEFAYPNGTRLDFNAETKRILRTSGIRLAVTTSQRHVSTAEDPFMLPRIGLSGDEPPAHRLLKPLAPSLARSEVRERRVRSLVA